MTMRDAARAAAGDGLSPAERRVVEAVLAEPARVAFGTVAELAARSGTSGPTVVRVARKLGLRRLPRPAGGRPGRAHRHGLAPAAERIRRTASDHDDPLGRALVTEVANVEATLRAADPAAFAAAVRLLADRRRRVLVIAGDAERGIAATAADQLGQLRDGVEVLEGTPPRVAARVALAGGDRRGARRRRPPLRRLGARRRWPPSATPAPASSRSPTDRSRRSRPARSPRFAVVAEGTGPFDSHVGTLALLHALVAGVADRLRGSATDRLDRIEAAWRATAALHD